MASLDDISLDDHSVISLTGADLTSSPVTFPSPEAASAAAFKQIENRKRKKRRDYAAGQFF